MGREVLVGVLLALASLPAAAMDMRVDGDAVILSGPVVHADCMALTDLLEKTTVKRVVLTNSGGGNAYSGYCIGALIRERGLPTTIRGRCASSCSRMWLGGVDRTLDGPNSRVGLHGNYNDGGGIASDAGQRLRTWIPQYAPKVDKTLMEQWIRLPSNKWMMYFYNDKAELCEHGTCKLVEGRTVLNAGLSTR
jgi:hypothetical protein